MASQGHFSALPDANSAGLRHLQAYREVKFLGKGAFAEVYLIVRCRMLDSGCDCHGMSLQEHKTTGERYAVKRVSREKYKDGVNLGAVKELQAMSELHHDHLIRLQDVFFHADRVNMVLGTSSCCAVCALQHHVTGTPAEFAATDLTWYIKQSTNSYTEAHVKTLARDLLSGLAFMHSKGWLHRDLKPDNCLITHDRQLKLADFGHAAQLPDGLKKSPSHLFTSWYRPPELCFGATTHGTPADVWAAGCILAEMLLRHPLFPGRGDSNKLQAAAIFRVTGTPTQASWPQHDLLPGHMQFAETPQQPWQQVLPSASAAAQDLLAQMLCLDPGRRISADAALRHDWFATHPEAAPSSSIALPGDAAAGAAAPAATT